MTDRQAKAVTLEQLKRPHVWIDGEWSAAELSRLFAPRRESLLDKFILYGPVPLVFGFAMCVAVAWVVLLSYALLRAKIRCEDFDFGAICR